MWFFLAKDSWTNLLHNGSTMLALMSKVNCKIFLATAFPSIVLVKRNDFIPVHSPSRTDQVHPPLWKSKVSRPPLHIQLYQANGFQYIFLFAYIPNHPTSSASVTIGWAGMRIWNIHQCSWFWGIEDQFRWHFVMWINPVWYEQAHLTCPVTPLCNTWVKVGHVAPWGT